MNLKLNDFNFYKPIYHRQMEKVHFNIQNVLMDNKNYLVDEKSILAAERSLGMGTHLKSLLILRNSLPVLFKS